MRKLAATVATLAATLMLAALPAPVVLAASTCAGQDRANELRAAQAGVLGMLDRGTPDRSDDLTTLEDLADLAELAALGYNFYPHHQTSLQGMAWPVLDTFTDPADQTAERPQLLLYTPTPPPPPGTVTHPRDGFDFPYRLRGWAYVPLGYDYPQHPADIPGLGCIERKDWFVHERGIHTFDDGDFDPYPPEEELAGATPHGTARGGDTTSLTPQLKPGDFPHGRSWDLHVWCSTDCVAPKSDVPTVSMLNPGTAIPGVDPNVGVSPPPNWPNPPYPSFYYPPSEGGLRVEEENCEGVQAVIKVPAARVDPLVPDQFTVSKDDRDRASLWVGANRCGRVIVGSSGRPTIYATFRIAIADPEPATSEFFNFYQLWLASDNEDQVRFYREHGGVADRDAVHAKDLVFTLDALGNFRFSAPSTPSPFEITATMTPPLTPPLNINGAFWAAVPKATPKGKLNVPNQIDMFQFGQVVGRVMPAAGSEMDRLFCDDADGSFSGPVGAVSEDPSSLATDSLSYFLPHASYTAEVTNAEMSHTDRARCP